MSLVKCVLTIISEVLFALIMAKAKTGSFYLTESVVLANGDADGTRVQGTVDLGAYVNVPTGQCVAIDQIDYIVQRGLGYEGNVGPMLAGNGALSYQVTDLNPGTDFVIASDQSLISSGTLNIDATNNIASHTNDLYPDNYGPGALSEMFLCVNDTLYLVAGNDGAAVGTAGLTITARIRARVVKLSSKDWMALAIQSTASDN